MELSKEEQEAIETINCLGICYKKEAEDLDFWGSISISVSENDYYAIQTLLNLISKLQKEIEKKDICLKACEDNLIKERQLRIKQSKVIDEMAKEIENMTGSCPLDRFDFNDIDCENKCNTGIEAECWKQYFYRKASNNEE